LRVGLSLMGRDVGQAETKQMTTGSMMEVGGASRWRWSR
jgi:hypothetical protein